MKRYTPFVLGVLLLVGLPSVALANAGTPLMLATLFHLIFGNAVIGIGEGILLAIFLRRNLFLCAAVMIVANYFSAWIGYFFFIDIFASSLHLDLNNAWAWFWGLVGISYLITLVLEWPFIAFCVYKKPDWIKKSIMATLLTQTISYALLCAWYFSVSQTSLYRNFTVVPPSEIAVSKEYQLYYISNDDGNVYQMDLESREPRKVADLESSSHFYGLAIQQSKNQPGKWDIVVQGMVGHELTYEKVSSGVECCFSTTKNGDWEKQLNWPNNTFACQLGKNASHKWRYKISDDDYGLCLAINSETGEKLVFAPVEVPYILWWCRSIMLTEDGKAIFQLGDDQICLLDAETKKIALLVKGRGPVVILPEK